MAESGPRPSAALDLLVACCQRICRDDPPAEQMAHELGDVASYTPGTYLLLRPREPAFRSGRIVADSRGRVDWLELEVVPGAALSIAAVEQALGQSSPVVPLADGGAHKAAFTCAVAGGLCRLYASFAAGCDSSVTHVVLRNDNRLVGHGLNQRS
jgi:hypothetical protein